MTITDSTTQTATITVDRCTVWSVGVRLWFVLRDINHDRYHRWSCSMDTSDEALILTQPGDVLKITWIEHAERGGQRDLLTVDFV